MLEHRTDERVVCQRWASFFLPYPDSLLTMKVGRNCETFGFPASVLEAASRNTEAHPDNSLTVRLFGVVKLIDCGKAVPDPMNQPRSLAWSRPSAFTGIQL